MTRGVFGVSVLLIHNGMLPFSLEFQSGLPPSDQLVDAVHKAIAIGDLKDQDLFPSVRTLASELKISPTTAHKAVLLLREEGLLFSHPGVGMRVRAPYQEGWDMRLELLRPKVDKLLQDAEALRIPGTVLRPWLSEQISDSDPLKKGTS